VLSGPNAGGKTVAMKCVGLLALLQASGLPVPVGAGSRLGFFARVFADIGDDQSLSRSLSTFSGHVERVRDVLSLSAGDSLVLLDELMGGTDPGEGTVLGVAALDALVARGAAVVVTTHYDGLKDHASSSEVLDNAAVGFDFSRMAPTFRVEQGRPGASSALAIAGRHGLPPQLLLRAEALLPEVERRRREDRIAIEQLRAELERERGELERERAELARQGRVLEQRAERLEEQRRSELARERDALLVDVRQARSEVRQLRTRMRHGPEAGGSRELERELDAAASLVALGSGVDQRLRGESPAAAESPALAVGSQVRVRGTAAVLVVLEEPRKGRVRVASGAMKLTVAVAELELVDARAARAEARPVRAAPRPAARPAAALDEPPAKTTDVCLDLRGRRVEESLDAVDAFLDDLLRRHESGGYILHGHGTGALKDALRSHLKGHPAVRAARPAEREEGGDAWTVVWLAGSD
jgi:DNA mismatch repair protein MutS2